LGDVAVGIGPAGEATVMIVAEEGLLARGIGDRDQALVGVMAVTPDPAKAIRVGGEVQLVVGVAVRGAVGIGDAGDPIGGVIAVADRPAFRIREGGDAVEGIVGEARRGGVVGVGDRGQVTRLADCRLIGYDDPLILVPLIISALLMTQGREPVRQSSTPKRLSEI